MRRLTTLSLGLAIVATLSAPSPAQQSAANERRVDSIFSRYNQVAAPGLAVAVVRDGKVVLSKGYGLADLEHRVPITSSTVFDVASVSKQFTGLAVAMLVGQGRIKLTDDIRKYIPEMGDVGHTITIDHLVHHTSGFRDWPGMLSLAGWRFDDVMSFAQILRFAYNQKTLNFVPGSEYSYSNTEYNLLAEMIQRVTGQSFRAWTDEQLFRPLGMADSHFQDDHTRVIPNRAFGYSRRPDGSYAAVTNNLTALGSSSLFSTVDDLAKWVMNFDDPKVGGAAAMTLTRTRGVLNNGSTIPYAFGIVDGEYRGVPNMNHSGGWATFSTFVLHFPRQHVGVIVLSNGGINASRAAYDVADIVLSAELAPRSAVAQSGGASTASVNVAPDVLDRYAGLYRLGPGWYVRLRRDGNVLKTQATAEAEASMRAVSESEFWVDAYNAPMQFQGTAGQRVSLLYRGRTSPKLDESAALSAAQLAEFAGEYESAELETRYRVDVKDGGLVMHHARHGSFALTRLWNDDFTGAPTAWFTRSVEFQRDAAGKVIGFSVRIDDRSRDVRFVKRR